LELEVGEDGDLGDAEVVAVGVVVEGDESVDGDVLLWAKADIPDNGATAGMGSEGSGSGLEAKAASPLGAANSPVPPSPCPTADGVGVTVPGVEDPTMACVLRLLATLPSVFRG